MDEAARIVADTAGVVGGGMDVMRGTVRVRLGRFLSAGGWSMGSNTFTFRWQDGALRLVGYDYTNVQRNSGKMDTLSINYVTRRVRIGTGSAGEDNLKTRWTTIAAAPLLTIDEVGDGFAFDPNGLVAREIGSIGIGVRSDAAVG